MPDNFLRQTLHGLRHGTQLMEHLAAGRIVGEARFDRGPLLRRQLVVEISAQQLVIEFVT